eukprot:3941970-Rhodomonas_salina.4
MPMRVPSTKMWYPPNVSAHVLCNARDSTVTCAPSTNRMCVLILLYLLCNVLYDPTTHAYAQATQCTVLTARMVIPDKVQPRCYFQHRFRRDARYRGHDCRHRVRVGGTTTPPFRTNCAVLKNLMVQSSRVPESAVLKYLGLSCETLNLGAGTGVSKCAVLEYLSLYYGPGRAVGRGRRAAAPGPHPHLPPR